MTAGNRLSAARIAGLASRASVGPFVPLLAVTAHADEAAPLADMPTARRDAGEVDHAADLPLVPIRRAFGRPGDVVLSSVFTLVGSSTRFSHSDAKFSGYTLGPAIDIFVARHVSVGVDLTVSHSDDTGYYQGSSALYESISTRWSAGARLAIDVPLSWMVSWWPRLTLGYAATHTEEPVATGGAYDGNPTPPVNVGVTDSHGAYVVLYAPLLLHPVSHFFVGFGPYVSRDLGRTASTSAYAVSDQTSVGAFVVIGGWR